jgi:hypothetical protein
VVATQLAPGRRLAPSRPGARRAIATPRPTGRWRRAGARCRADAVALLLPPWQALRRGQLSRFWLGPAAAGMVLLLWEIAGTRTGQAFLQRWAVMRGDQPWWLTVQKVPLSLLAPAYLLPCGFAMLQVFVVFGAAQVLVGVRRTVAVALAAHVLGSFSLRLWVWIGSPVGLPTRYLHMPDAGPSVAALALAVFLVVRLRVLWLAALLVAYHLVEWFAITGLAQREHLIGAATGALLGAASLVPRTAWRSPRGAWRSPRTAWPSISAVRVDDHVRRADNR